MTDLVKKIGNNYNLHVQSINERAKSIPQFSGEVSGMEKKTVDELAPAINHSAVKTPMSYVKTGDIKLPYGYEASCYKLSNGQRVIVIPKEGETVVKTYVNTGSMNEPDNIRGISHYIEHNLFNGSEGLEAGEFFKTTDKMGADTNASTGMAETNYYIASHLLNEGDLENKIRIHSSMLETPRFALDMLEKEKGVVNSEINMITSNSEDVAYNNTMKNLFNIKTSSADVVAGTTANITNLTREDVVNYFNANYYPANMVTVVSGEVEPEETIKLVSKYFSSNKQPPQERYYEKLEPIQKTVRQDIISNKAHSTFVMMGFAGPENNNSKDRVYLDALTKLMFSMNKSQKLFDALNTSVGCTSEKVSVKPSDKRAIMLMANVSEDNSEKLLKLIYSRVNKYQNNLISDEDLKTLKRNIKSEFSNMFEYSAVINSLVGQSSLEGCLDGIRDYEKIIDEMTPQDLMNTARKYFDLKKTAITVMHPETSDSKSIQKNYDTSKDIAFTGALKKQAVNIENVKQYNLPNNFRVVLNDSSLPSSVFSLTFDTPQQIKAENPAVYAVLSDMLGEGSAFRNKPDLEDLKEKNGILTDVSAGNDGIGVNALFDVSDSGKALDIIKEVVENPRFDEDTFNIVKNRLIDSLKRADKTPENKLNPELFPNSYHTKEELLSRFEDLTLDDVKKLYSQIVKSSSASVTVSAPFNENPDLKKQLFAKINSFNAVKPFKYEVYDNFVPQTEVKVFTEPANKNQAKIVMAYKFKNSGNLKDDVTVRLLNTILGGGPSSRLFTDLREQQKLAYSVNSKVHSNGNTSAIKLSIGTTTDNQETGEKSFDNLQKSINGFRAHVEKLRTEKVTPEELESAKLSVKNEILSNVEPVSGRTDALVSGNHSYYGLTRSNRFLDMIDEITVDDIYNAAQNIFKDKPIYSIVATKNTLNYNQEYLDNLKRA